MILRIEQKAVYFSYFLKYFTLTICIIKAYKNLDHRVQAKEGQLFLTEERRPNDRPFTLTCDMFGFQAGQELPLCAGLSEFLSALVMHKELTGILPEKDILPITVCIEATIPFRGKNDRGESYPEMLEQRLTTIQQRDKLFMNPGEIEEIIKRAVVFANKDAENFAEHDPGKFLDHTWKLLPETNVSLRAREIYSIKDYRQALQKMEEFFGGLNLDNIFHRYRGVPAEPEFQHKVKSAYTNVAIAREYLGIKLLTMIILEAFADLTGGDVPLSLVMGDLQKEGENTPHLEDFLPVVEEYRFIDHASPVFQLLETGRARESSFDLKNSPLSAFLYKQMGAGETQTFTGECQRSDRGNPECPGFFEADGSVNCGYHCQGYGGHGDHPPRAITPI